MRTSLHILLGCCALLALLPGCTVDAEELQEAITDSFSPDINYWPSFARINEIRSSGSSPEEYRTRLIYEGNEFYRGAKIKYVWNSGECSSWVAYLNWDQNDTERLLEAYTGTAPETFNPSKQEDVENFLAVSDKWLFSYTNGGELEQVRLENEPQTYRRFTYNSSGDFFDSIIDYEGGRIQKILKYQYSGELTNVLELDQAGDTTAVYTYEYEFGNKPGYSGEIPFDKSRLVAIPNARCSYLYLHGPLWAWHYPFPVKKLFRNGMLVYEASYKYDEAGIPVRVEYSRRDDDGNMVDFYEEVLSGVITL